MDESTRNYLTILQRHLYRIGRQVRLMEVCGTHTVAIRRFGLHELIPDGIELLSGPGCPVCVTPASYIDAALLIADRSNVIVATFGDMMRVPSSTGETLLQKRAEGARIQIVYSPLDVLRLAREHTDSLIVFLSVGFETTTPGTAILLSELEKEHIENVRILAANKLVPPALDAILTMHSGRLDGLICPGHVSAIIGIAPYRDLVERFKTGCAIAGFAADDILGALCALLAMLDSNKPDVINMYRRVVREEGNPAAMRMLEQYFEPETIPWRGLGAVPASGLKLRGDYQRYDAGKEFDVTNLLHLDSTGTMERGCRCGDVICGLLHPPECPLFGKRCTPESPVGPCMVSTEGSCAAYYRYPGTLKGNTHD